MRKLRWCSEKRGRKHVSPRKGTNHAGKMTFDEAKASLAHIKEVKNVDNQVKEHLCRQRIRALKRYGLGMFVKYLQKSYALATGEKRALKWEDFVAVNNGYAALSQAKNEY